MALLINDDTWGILTVWQEARGEPFEGKIAVAEVIQRRAKKHYSSDGTIAGTVLRRFQFSGWNTGDPNRIPAAKLDSDDPVVKECIQAWEEAKMGSNFSKGALLYYNPSVVDPFWSRSSIEVSKIGNHRFMVPSGTQGGL